jgi:hypothetical protein
MSNYKNKILGKICCKLCLFYNIRILNKKNVQFCKGV